METLSLSNYRTPSPDRSSPIARTLSNSSDDESPSADERSDSDHEDEIEDEPDITHQNNRNYEVMRAARSSDSYSLANGGPLRMAVAGDVALSPNGVVIRLNRRQ